MVPGLRWYGSNKTYKYLQNFKESRMQEICPYGLTRGRGTPLPTLLLSVVKKFYKTETNSSFCRFLNFLGYSRDIFVKSIVIFSLIVSIFLIGAQKPPTKTVDDANFFLDRYSIWEEANQKM